VVSFLDCFQTRRREAAGEARCDGEVVGMLENIR
jgi:hypothetical protein